METTARAVVGSLVATVVALIGFGLFVASASALAVTSPVGPGQPAERGYAGQPAAAPGELIVGFKKSADIGARQQALAGAGATEKRRLAKIDAAVVGVAEKGTKRAIEKLRRDPRVRYVEPNYVVVADDHGGAPNDPDFHLLWGLDNFGQTIIPGSDGNTGTPDADIDASEAWQVTTGSPTAVVGVIDTGVDFSHPDLGGSMETSPVMWINPGENCAGCRTDGRDNDGNGYVDDYRGWDFANRDNNPTDDSSIGHGTHVAGTIGAIGNNGVGITGVSWNAKIMALKFLGADGGGYLSDAIAALLYASANGAQVTNNSWGCQQCYSEALADAIRAADAAGTLVVVSAGNDGADMDQYRHYTHYPSEYELPNIVSVAATTSKDERAPFSNFGRRAVDLAAPGDDIYSTVPGGYRFLSGTSMAAPHVAGAAALAKAVFPTASHLGLKALLLGTVDALPALPSATDGRLNVNRAVRCTNRPKVWIDAPVAAFEAAAGEAVTVKVIAATCANPAGVTVQASANGSPIGLTARGDGLYVGSYVPQAEGPVTITASATAGGASDSRGVSGTALRNYLIEDAPFQWVDATDGGTKIPIDDAFAYVPLALPFPFTFYGKSATSLTLSDDGILLFDEIASTFENLAIPNTQAPNGVIAALWDDFNVAAAGSVWARTVGTAPARRFVIAWVDVAPFSWQPHPGRVTFEIVLEEATNDIVLQYRDVDFGDPGLDYGASHTVGIESHSGQVGKQFSFDTPALKPYENQKAIRFRAPRPLNTALPAISGSAVVGQVQRASTGSWTNSPSEYRYAWQQCDATGNGCAAIAALDPKASWYTLRATDAGRTIRVAVSAINSAGTSAPATSAQTALVASSAAPGNTALPAISGSAVVGQVQRASTGSWTNSPSEYRYAWQQCDATGNGCAAIAALDPKASWYTLRATDAGRTIRVAVTAINSAGTSAPATSAQTALVASSAAPGNTALPAISGSAVVGQVQRASTGSWTNSPSEYRYAWQQCDATGNGCAAIAALDPKASWYTLRATDAGRTIRVAVTAINSAGTSAPATSAQTALVR